MICPYCGTHIADGLTICPACHADLTKAVPDASAIQTERYCKSCGALIPEGATVCPNCGMPVEEEAIQPAEKAAVQLQQQQEKPHLASAIPAASDPYSATTANERMPRRRVFLVSFIAALIVVGGAVLLITQPWNPDPYSLKATEAADTSMAGFPGGAQQAREPGQRHQRCHQKWGPADLRRGQQLLCRPRGPEG